MGDVCTHKYLLSVCLFVRHFESRGLGKHYVEYLFGNDFAFALNLWRYCFLEEKRRRNMIAELGEILNRKLDSGEKLDKTQPLQRPWSVEVATG